MHNKTIFLRPDLILKLGNGKEKRLSCTYTVDILEIYKGVVHKNQNKVLFTQLQARFYIFFLKSRLQQLK